MDINKPLDEWFQYLAGIVLRIKMDFAVTYDDDKIAWDISYTTSCGKRMSTHS
jgi:hypothetical protein